MTAENGFEKWDRWYQTFKERNPGTSVIKMEMERVAQKLKTGASHPTLGANIDGHADWWEAGISSFTQYVKQFDITPAYRMVDYGCGSLRVGAHFIRYLDRGHYFGLELASGLYELGQDVIGETMLAQKRPRFGLIDTDAMDEATAFGADIVYSTAVAFHVHPDELAQYHANLLKLTAKPGAILVFDTKISEQPLRYRTRAWAWPMQMYLDALAPLRFEREILMQKREENGVPFENRILQFRRPG
jgi:SAM-dependent methyltransferase